VLEKSGTIIVKQRLSTTPKALGEVFGQNGVSRYNRTVLSQAE
jgi:hypothetical protein